MKISGFCASKPTSGSKQYLLGFYSYSAFFSVYIFVIAILLCTELNMHTFQYLHNCDGNYRETE